MGSILKLTLEKGEDKMGLQTYLSVIFISQIRGENHDGINMYLIPNLGISENAKGITEGGPVATEKVLLLGNHLAGHELLPLCLSFKDAGGADRGAFG